MNPREQLTNIFRSALRAVNPADLLQERLRKIPEGKSIVVIGAGKAAASMAQAMEEFLLQRIVAGLVVVKDGYARPLQKIQLLSAGHPLPDERSLQAGEKVFRLLQGLRGDELVVALISGGASSLLVRPQGISAEKLILQTQGLLQSGRSIGEVNQQRRQWNAFSSGGLARAAAPCQVIAFILSDVIGNDLASIGSGSTVVGPAESQRVQNIIIGDNALAVGGAVQGAKRFQYDVRTVLEPIVGEAREQGIRFAKQVMRLPMQSALIGGGETTVSLGSKFGRGGRCQEAALAAAMEIQGQENIHLLFVGTDGSDGPTDAAGAFVDGTTIPRAKTQGLDPNTFLQNHDSYTFFQQLGDLFQPGPTFTNVADLFFGLS